jgi:hypothetical protein
MPPSSKTADKKDASNGFQLPLQLAAMIRGEACNGIPPSTIPDAKSKRKRGGEASDDVQCVDVLADEAAAAEIIAVATLPGAASLVDDTAKNTVGSLNQIVSSVHNRHVKELGSYVRAVCMRMGFHPSSSDPNE